MKISEKSEIISFASNREIDIFTPRIQIKTMPFYQSLFKQLLHYVNEIFSIPYEQ